MEMNAAPLVLQRHCDLRFEVRADGKLVDGQPGFDGGTEPVRTLALAAQLGRIKLKEGALRVQVRAILQFESEAVNEKARAQAGKDGTERAIGWWEVFADDLVYAPQGPRGLPKHHFNAALELQDNETRELVE